jgi:hypothetical protein
VTDQRTGEALVQVLRDSPLGDLTIDHEPTYAISPDRPWMSFAGIFDGSESDSESVDAVVDEA